MTTQTLAAPDRALTQRLDALHRANEIRSERARLKHDLKAGRRHIIPLLVEPPGWLATMKVIDLLLATPKRGPAKVARVLRRTQITPSRTVGGLSSRQRDELVAELNSCS